MEAADLKKLFDRYLKGTCTREEIENLLSYFRLEKGDENTLQEMIEEELSRIPPADWEKDPAVAMVLDRVQSRLQDEITGGHRPAGRGISFPLKQIAAAVALFGIIAWAFYRFHPGGKENLSAEVLPANDVLPGGNKASLILTDGSVVDLSDAPRGQVAALSGGAVSKIADGEVRYDRVAGSREQLAIRYHILSVPNGGQFKITLPDGSQAWLNAASTLRFPTRFDEHERRVFLTGEGYFEVSGDGHRPFLVESGSQVVRVVGTHFNIKAYAGEEAVRTTLLEGVVDVSSTEQPEKPVRLRPGQQAIASPGAIRTVPVDAEQAVAWKNGVFNFQNASLNEIIRQLERWYDVEFIYGSLPDVEFIGTVPRSAKLSSVLNALELTSDINIRFKIEGKTIRLME